MTISFEMPLSIEAGILCMSYVRYAKSNDRAEEGVARLEDLQERRITTFSHASSLPIAPRETTSRSLSASPA